jgi:carbamoyl-phosphate synthase small subunit
VSITSQNHGFAIDPSSLPSNVEVTHINLNDGTVEGMRHREAPVLSVQYHPEAAPGPHDAKYFFAEFARMIETGQVKAGGIQTLGRNGELMPRRVTFSCL